MADANLSGELKELNSVAKQILDHLQGKEESEAANPEQKQRKQAEAELKKLNAQVSDTADSFINVGKQFFSIVEAGAKLAGTLGQTVTQGIRQEFVNRATITSQMLTTDRDRIISGEQLVSAQQALTDTFVSVGEGMEISAAGAAEFAQSLKGGFKSDFKLTGDSMRALITAGVATEAGFENLRKSSGRASLSNEQLSNLVNKNSLSFMLYGPKFAKAAVEAEKLGINLAQVQSAQESMVTNLDGTLDTLNQVNQLGAQIDFGTLMRLNEFEGPEATLKYLQSTIPPSLFQSASTRALLKGFGISTEDLMKRQGSAQEKAAKTMEDAMTKLAEPIGALSSIISNVYQRSQALLAEWGGLIKGIGIAIASFISLAASIGTYKAATLVAKSAGLQIGGLGGLFSAGKVADVAKETAAGDAGAGNITDKITSKGAGAGSVLRGLGAGMKALAAGFRAFANPMVAAGVGVVTLAIIGLGVALRIAAPGIVAVGTAIKSVLEGVATVVTAIGTAIATVITSIGGAIANVFKSISLLSPVQLIAVGASLYVLGASLVGFTAAGLLAIPTLLIIANRITALSSAASGVQVLANSFKELVATIEKLNATDLGKLKDLNATMPRVGPVGMAVAAIAANARATTAAGRPAAEGSDLTRKIDELIRVLRDTKTVINVDNKLQQVPRTALAGVNIRNDRV